MENTMSDKQPMFPESIMVYFPDGGKSRIRDAAKEAGMSMSTYIRSTVLDRVKRESN